MITPARKLSLYASPADIFVGGVDGVWYDPSDITSLFQDSAGTTPVTADGDPVGLMLDLSGNGFHASQATAGNRPVYKTDGVSHWLQLTSANSQFMIHNANAPGTGEFLGVYAYESVTAGVTPFLAFGSGISTTYTGMSFRVGSGHQIQINGADATSSGGLVSNGIGAGKRLISATRTVTYAQGSTVTLNTNTLGTLNLTNANKRLFCFYTFTNQAFMNGKFFGGVYIRGATAPQQRQLIQEYLARKSNIAVANSASSWSVINPVIQKVTL